MRNAREFRAEAWHALTGKYWWAVLAALIAGVLGGAASVPELTFQFDISDANWVIQRASELDFSSIISAYAFPVFSYGTVLNLAVFIIGGAMELGFDRYMVGVYSSEPQDLSKLFSRFDIFGQALLLRLLIWLRVFAWSLLLVIPGIIAGYRYALAPYILAEHPELTPTEAIEESKKLMMGNKWRLFCMQFSFIGWYLLAGLTAGVGACFLTPYTKAADAAFYLERTGRLPIGGGQTPPSGNADGDRPAGEYHWSSEQPQADSVERI